MSEILIISLVSRKQPSLNLTVTSMSILQLLPNLTSQVLRLNLIKFRLTQSMKQVVGRLVVGVVHIPRSWSKEVNWMNISCVHCNIPKDTQHETGSQTPCCWRHAYPSIMEQGS
jgi:hypothetical protein